MSQAVITRNTTQRCTNNEIGKRKNLNWKCDSIWADFQSQPVVLL